MMTKLTRKMILCSGAAMMSLMLATTVCAQQRDFDIPAQDANKAVAEFARQSGVQVIAPGQQLRGLKSKAIKGQIDARAALTAMLAGTGLVIASDDGAIITLKKASPVPQSGTVAGEAAGEDDITKVVITGTHIRGGNPTSPVHTVTRKDIEQSGYSQVGDVMRSLPENFSGGQNPGVFGTSNGGNANVTNASTVNLRGLGTDATLVLINGHRLSADSFYQGSDISGIPLSAVQRIEIVPDGASALYGSDAVAGVVNIIMRSNYDGAEVSARAGGSTQGGGAENTYQALVGRSGERWFGLVNMEYSKQGEIKAGQRDFATAAPDDATLLLGQERRSMFFRAGGTLTNLIKLSVDGLISDRDASANFHYSDASDIAQTNIYTPSYSLATVLDVDLSAGWQMHVTAVGAGSRNVQSYYYPAYDYAGVSRYKNDVQYVESTADGTLFALPSGPVKVAFGAGYREEGYKQAGYVDTSRNVSYFYGEALVPLVVPSTDRVGLHELEINFSGRTESYSDFGSTTNPKVGLRYVPTDDLSVRATWGKSFKAPSFTQMYQQYSLYLYPAEWFGYAETGKAAIMTWGGNKGLKPEKSTSWTLGADFNPARMKSMKLSATYFDIDYTDRVLQPVTPYSRGLSDPLFASFINNNPSAEAQAELLSQTSFFYNATGSAYDPSTVIAILNNRFTNATSQVVKGLDLSYTQRFDLAKGTLTTFANATFTRLDQRTIAMAPNERLSGTIFNVPKLKSRGGFSWQNAGLSASMILNYISSEIDTAVTPGAEVASWTTADATLAYSFDDAGRGPKGLKVSLSASNLFDKDPPRTISPVAFPGLNFDSTNTSIIGRFVSLTVQKAW